MKLSILVSTLVLAATAHADGPPKPPQEVADLAKAMSGTWTCTGKADIGGTMADVKGTSTHKLDLDGWWVQTSITASAGKATMHMTFLTTYDAGAKKWYRETANSMGGHGTHWGTWGDKKGSWEGEVHAMGKDLKTRYTEEMVSPKESHETGEYSVDGGKTWKPDHDITCKK
jgi:hypothetical protein